VVSVAVSIPVPVPIPVSVPYVTISITITLSVSFSIPHVTIGTSVVAVGGIAAATSAVPAIVVSPAPVSVIVGSVASLAVRVVLVSGAGSTAGWLSVIWIVSPPTLGFPLGVGTAWGRCIEVIVVASVPGGATFWFAYVFCFGEGLAVALGAAVAFVIAIPMR
jgi:hypothetical protein